MARHADNLGDARPLREVVIDSNRYPESARHIREAQQGRIWQSNDFVRGEPKPDVVHIDRGGADANRQEALRDIEPRGRDGLDRDEYPPAVFREGGDGASVKYINASDNRGAGGSIGGQISGLPDGTPVRIVVK